MEPSPEYKRFVIDIDKIELKDDHSATRSFLNEFVITERIGDFHYCLTSKYSNQYKEAISRDISRHLFTKACLQKFIDTRGKRDYKNSRIRS